MCKSAELMSLAWQNIFVARVARVRFGLGGYCEARKTTV